MIQAKDKKLIQDLIAENQTENAIRKFRSLLEEAGAGGNSMADLLSISARFSHLTEEKSRGVIFKDEEDVLRNRIHVDLGNLLERVSQAPEKKSAGKTETATPSTKKVRSASPKTSTKATASPPPTIKPTPTPGTGKETGIFSGWTGWLLLIGAGVAGYFLLTGWPGSHPNVTDLKICTLDARGQDFCCMQDQPLIPFMKSGGFYVSLTLSEGDPLVRGVVYAKNGGLVNTQALQLTQEPGSGCYSGLIAMPPGVSWEPGNYILEILVNNEQVGSKEFSIGY